MNHVTSPAQRQTARYLSDRLTAAGLKPVSRFGQNFLIDLNLVELIARSAEMRRTDVVLEVGTGVGSLTSIMADQAGAILTVEIDKNLHELASQEVGYQPNVRLLQMDALKNKNTLRPEIMDSIRDAMSRITEGADDDAPARFMLVANLPYNIATPLISNLLHEDPMPDRIVVTIQKELADRMMAAPGTKDYGALSIWVQSVADVRIERVLPPTVFWPRPKVDSAVIRIDTDRSRRDAIPDHRYFHSTVRALFFHRRKFLRSVVCSAMKGRLEKSTVDEILDRLHLDASIRAETLTPPQIAELVEALRIAEVG